MSNDSHETFLWHDYETYGSLMRPWDWKGSVAPRRARPSQFAGIRTTMDLEEIEEPIEFRCCPSLEEPPSIDACLVTGSIPQDHVDEEEEHAFFQKVRRLFEPRGTCGVGWNSLQYDDAVTRFGFWRNLMPVYAREYSGGNSRWDLLPVFRLAFATRPEEIEWPVNDDGKVSMRLEDLAPANGIDGHDAHDAVGDVRATISLAKIFRERLPKLWDHALSMRRPEVVDGIIDDMKRPFLISDKGIGPDRGHATVAVTLYGRGKDRIAIDLHGDPKELLEHSAEEIHRRYFNRAEDEERLPIRKFRTNQFPMVAPVSVLKSEESWERLMLDKDVCRERANFIEEHRDALSDRLGEVLGEYPEGEDVDAEEALYGGGFVNDDSWRAIAQAKSEGAESLKRLEHNENDPRVSELLFRFRARHHFETLDERDHSRWQAYVQERLCSPGFNGNPRTMEGLARIEEIRAKGTSDQRILDAVRDWTITLGIRAGVEVAVGSELPGEH